MAPPLAIRLFDAVEVAFWPLKPLCINSTDGVCEEP